MKHVMSWIVDHTVASIVLAVVVSIGFGLGARELIIDSSANGLLIKGDPDVEFYQKTKETFGDDIILTLVVKAPDIFRPAILQSITDMTLDAQGMEGVTRVVSLATVNNLKGSDGLLETDPLLPYVPEDPEELEEVKQNALGNAMFRGEVINKAGTTAAIHLFLETRADDPAYNGRITQAAENMLEAQRSTLGDAAELYQCGPPLLKNEIVRYITRDGTVLLPFSLVALFLVLYWFFRTTAAIVIPGITGILSVLITIGFMGMLDFALNPVSVMIPSLLVVVGATEDIHLLAEYGIGLRDKQEKAEAIRRMAIRSGVAILLTSLTTFVGFATIAPNAIPILREFGIASSFGIAMNFIVTILLVPSILKFFPTPHFLGKEEGRGTLRIKAFLETTALDRRRFTLLGVLLVVGLCVVGCFRVVVDTDYLSFFRENSMIRQRYADLTKNLVGGNNFYVVVEGRNNGVMKQAAPLQDVAKLTDFLAGRYDKVMGYADLLRRTHTEMNGGDPAYYMVPDSSDLIAQYTLMMNQDDLNRFVDFGYKRTCILVRARIRGSGNLLREKREIEAFAAKELSRDLKFKVTGESVLVAGASDTISRELVINLTYVLVTIFAFVSILFASLKAGALAMIPNMLPILVNFGAMGFLGIPLSTSTFPVAIIALGIAVDDTIHLMVRYSKEIKTSSTNAEAMISTINQEYQPVTASSIALMCGFGILIMGQFGSTMQFGILATLVVFAALISDLFVTPALLLTTPLVTRWDLLMMSIDRAVAANSPLFRGLSVGDMKRVGVMAEVRQYKPGEHILLEGETGKDMMVLLKGKAEVRSEAKNVLIDTVSGGAVVGEMAFLTDRPRSASVVAADATECLVFNAGTLQRVQQRFPRVAAKVFYNIAQTLSERLRHTTDELVGEDR